MDRAEAIELLDRIALRNVFCTLEEDALEAFWMATEAMREQEQKWISVEERLPEPFVSVLGYCPEEEPLPTVHEVYMSDFGQWCSPRVYGMEKVTHWMPLPEPPKEGAEG